MHKAANPQFIAENILNREFSADAPDQKWLTDVSEFKYYVAQEVHKVYLSAILEFFDCLLDGERFNLDGAQPVFSAPYIKQTINNH